MYLKITMRLGCFKAVSFRCVNGRDLYDNDVLVTGVRSVIDVLLVAKVTYR